VWRVSDLQWLRAAPASLSELHLEQEQGRTVRPVPNAEAAKLERFTSLHSLHLVRVFEIDPPAAAALEQRLRGVLPRLTQFAFETVIV